MIDDLKERLWTITSSGCNPYSLCHEAAARITDLEARLVAAEAKVTVWTERTGRWVKRAEDARAGEDALAEALRSARDTLRGASRQLTEAHGANLKGRIWGQMTLETVSAVLAAYEARRKG